MRTVRQGQLSLLFNIPALIISLSFVCYCALVMYAYFAKCDPLSAGEVNQADQARFATKLCISKLYTTDDALLRSTRHGFYSWYCRPLPRLSLLRNNEVSYIVNNLLKNRLAALSPLGSTQ